MNKGWIVFIFAFSFLLPAQAGGKEDKQLQALRQAITTLQSLTQPMPKPGSGDWLAMHEEPGQTFEQFLTAVKTPLPKQRKKIYTQAVGDFHSGQKVAEAEAARFLGIFYNLPNETKPTIALTEIPATARRKNPYTGQEQILTRYIMEEKILPVLPKDTAIYMAFTATDLYPGDDWNFVFGEASGDDPMGIWSLARYGDPDTGAAAFQKCLRRTLKVATHEAGHMLGLMHCTAHRCGMNGTNSLAEEDARPLAFCPECLAKVCWVTKTDIKDHCRRVALALREYGFSDDAAVYEGYLKALEKK